MEEDLRVLIKLLNSVDLSLGDQVDESLFKLSKLKEFVNFPLYGQSIYLKYNGDPEGLRQLADALLYKAISLYNLKEYQRSFYLILINIFSFKPINLQLIKLIIANFHYLGHFTLAAQLYVKYFELTQDLDCLYFAGICYSLVDKPHLAVANFEQFLALVESSAQARQSLKELTKSCHGLIKNIRAQEAIPGRSL